MINLSEKLSQFVPIVVSILDTALARRYLDATIAAPPEIDSRVDRDSSMSRTHDIEAGSSLCGLINPSLTIARAETDHSMGTFARPKKHVFKTLVAIPGPRFKA